MSFPLSCKGELEYTSSKLALKTYNKVIIIIYYENDKYLAKYRLHLRDENISWLWWIKYVFFLNHVMHVICWEFRYLWDI